MNSITLSSLALLATLLPAAYAQTHTSCNPLNTTGCPPMQALGGNATFDFTKKGIPVGGKIWSQENQGALDWNEKGATFTVSRSGDAPMVMSNFYMLFGRYEVVLKAAPGTGIVSSAILQSEDLDEIDWEFLGGNTTDVMTNYYGKGNTTFGDRGQNFKMSSPPQDDFHNYTVDWTKDRIQWWVDGNMLRELTPAQALNGKNYPQTPMNIRLGIWAGGDKANNAPGVVAWAGGETNFKDGPFTMTVQSVYAIDYTQGAEYTWDNMDASGDWQKVKVISGTSGVMKAIQSPSGMVNHWKALPQVARISIIIGSLALLGIVLCGITICCIKQRRAGRREYAANLMQEQKEAAELQEYKRQMQAGKFGFGSGAHRV